MRYPSDAIVNELRKKYPAGTRVELVEMDDPQAPPAGTKGTVYAVDDTGSLCVNWDNGSGLNVIYGHDLVEKIVMTTICCGEKMEWAHLMDAEQYFLQGIANTTGEEQMRYKRVYSQLSWHKDFCSDEDDEAQ